jgi:AraC-like DNA-binding protein
MTPTKTLHLQAIPIPRPLQIQSISSVLYYRYSPTFVFSGEKHRQWEFVYVDKGAVLIESSGKIYSLKAGEFFLHRPNEVHKIKADSTSSDVFIMTFLLAQGLSYLRPLSDAPHPVSSEGKDLLAILLEENRRVFAQTDFFAKKIHYENKPDSLQIIANLMESFLLSALRGETPASKETEKSPLVQKILLSVQNHLASPALLREVSIELGYSEGYLSKCFKKSCHISLKTYQLHQRIEKAKTLLFAQEKSLSDIAEELGFSSLQHFSKAFKKETHYSPSAYRSAALAKNLYDPFVSI